MLQASDKDLLILTHRGDRAAAAALHARCAPRMLAYARARLGDWSRAEDCVQQAFVQVLGCSVEQVVRVDDVAAWLIGATRNVAMNLARTEARSALRERVHAARDALSGLTAIERDDDQAEILAGLDKLPDDSRELLLLKHIAGLTFDQIALSLGVNRNTLAGRYRAALDQLRTALPDRVEVHHE